MVASVLSGLISYRYRSDWRSGITNKVPFLSYNWNVASPESVKPVTLDQKVNFNLKDSLALMVCSLSGRSRSLIVTVGPPAAAITEVGTNTMANNNN